MIIYFAGTHREIPPKGEGWGEAVLAFFTDGPGGGVLSSYEYFKNGTVDKRFHTICKLRGTVCHGTSSKGKSSSKSSSRSSRA